MSTMQLRSHGSSVSSKLEHEDWDNKIERMGGGKKARNARMNPIFDARCEVTAFDMHVQLTGDGRERGLWIWLIDESKARAETYDQWAVDALDTFCELSDIDDKTRVKFKLSLSMEEFKRIANARICEAALLEWSIVKEMYDAIGKALASHDSQQAPADAPATTST